MAVLLLQNRSSLRLGTESRSSGVRQRRCRCLTRADLLLSIPRPGPSPVISSTFIEEGSPGRDQFLGAGLHIGGFEIMSLFMPFLVSKPAQPDPCLAESIH